jgi:hypothetical protein
VGDDDVRDAALVRPRAHAAQGQAVGDLQAVWAKGFHQGFDVPRVHHAVAAGVRDLDCGQGDAADSAGQFLVGVAGARHDQHHLVAQLRVAGAEVVQRRAEAARLGAVEVGQLHDPQAAAW